MEKKIGKENFIFDYARANAPCLKSRPGEVVIFETANRFSSLEELTRALRKKKKSPIVAVTGPLYIEDAEPGSALKVEILKLRLTSPDGYAVVLPRRGLFGSRIRKNHIKKVGIEKGKVRFTHDISFPLTPMVGRIGVAPRRGAIPSDTPGAHGGNLDCKEIGEAATVYLPIFVRGALLALGDIHAAMGDGECGLSGIETEGEVTLRCSLVHGLKIKEPFVVTGDRILALASAPSLDEAVKKALSNMVAALQSRLDIGFEEAVMLMSAVSDVGICQLVNPLITAKASVPNSLMPFP